MATAAGTVVPPVTNRLLLDEMLSDAIAEQLRDKGHDVLAVVADPALVTLPDPGLLARATSDDRAVVARNIKDFMALDAHYRASGALHAGLVLVATKTFPDNRHAFGAIVSSLDELLSGGGIERGAVVFLEG